MSHPNTNNTYRITIKLQIKPTQKRKRLAIIGAGPGGLVSAKYALDKDIIPVVFDAKSEPGGLWVPGSSIWDGMHTNVSRYQVMFSDFPWPEGTSIIPSSRDVNNYLHRYIQHFGLEKYLSLNSYVETIRQLPNKKWQVTWLNFLTKERITKVFDFLICASGLHCKPHFPSVPNAENFEGVILHSGDYRSTDEQLRRKRVVIVGNSYSGVEIASHLVGHAHSIVNVFKRPYLVLPRLLRLPCEDKNEAGKNCFHIIPIDMIFGRELTFGAKTKEEERRTKINLYKSICPHQTSKKHSHPAMYYELDDDEPVREAVTDNYYPYIMQGKIIPKQSSIKRFEKNGVILEDGSYFEADAVMFCTGYRLWLDYLDENIRKKLNFDPKQQRMPILLYKYTVHPDLPNLSMVGQINGLFFAGFESQARWSISLFAGEQTLPSREVMYADMARDAQYSKQMQNNQYQHGVYNELIDKLAYEAGSLPDFEKIKNQDPLLYEMLWKNGTIPSHFCYNTNPEFALKMMKEVHKIINKKYYFDDKELTSYGTAILAEKFSKNFKIPLHLFKA